MWISLGVFWCIMNNMNSFLSNIRIAIFLGLIFIPVGFSHALTSAQISKKTNASYTRVFYYQEGKNAIKSFNANLNSIDVLAPQIYSFNSKGKLVGNPNADVLITARDNGIKVMPLVTNGSFGQASLETILNHPENQDAYIAQLVTEARKYDYWGWQLDFEQMDLSYRDKFSSFVKKFGDTMRREGLVSSVAVIAQVSENPADYPKNLWQRIIGVYDYKALADSTDFISLMSYDDPESKGPVARYSWMEKVIKHSLTLIPAEKLSLGVPLYYWKWDDATGKLVGIGGYSGMKTTLNTYKVTKGYSETEQAPYIKYAKAKKKYTIWYEDGKSIGKKLDLITKNNLHGFSAWALGLETPDVHKVIVSKAFNIKDLSLKK
jgi:spore germination protein YaaH